MTIQEAIKTGKPFRHQYSISDEWYFVTPHGYIGGSASGADRTNPYGISIMIVIKAEELLSNDWMVLV